MILVTNLLEPIQNTVPRCIRYTSVLALVLASTCANAQTEMCATGRKDPNLVYTKSPQRVDRIYRVRVANPDARFDDTLTVRDWLTKGTLKRVGPLCTIFFIEVKGKEIQEGNCREEYDRNGGHVYTVGTKHGPVEINPRWIHGGFRSIHGIGIDITKSEAWVFNNPCSKVTYYGKSRYGTNVKVRYDIANEVYIKTSTQDASSTQERLRTVLVLESIEQLQSQPKYSRIEF